jgi:hypothetical protein
LTILSFLLQSSLSPITSLVQASLEHWFETNGSNQRLYESFRLRNKAY